MVASRHVDNQWEWLTFQPTKVCLDCACGGTQPVRRFRRFLRCDSDRLAPPEAARSINVERRLALRTMPTEVARIRLTVGEDINASQNNPAAKFAERKPIGSWGRGMESSEAIVGPELRALLWRLAPPVIMMAAVGRRSI
jgi:hypothetical protein